MGGAGACSYATYLRKITETTTAKQCADACAAHTSCAYFSQSSTNPYPDKCYLYSSCAGRESYLRNVWTTYSLQGHEHCCEAETASCLACKANMTEYEFCKEHAGAQGCPDWTYFD